MEECLHFSSMPLLMETVWQSKLQIFTSSLAFLHKSCFF